jgi:thioredoxin-like negative regulator of GroEL
VHGLETGLAGRLRVIRLNIDDQVGQRARAVYGVEKVPTVILLNAAGSEAYRTEGKLPRTGQIRETLATLE